MSIRIATMTKELTRLELTWPGKDERFNPEPRILLEDKAKSYGDAESGNMLIHGDNLLALKALEQDYAGKVKCIYIDPPYNTGNAFEHYDDGLEHSIWLSLMRDRLEILKRLLAEDGSIWITLDDNEQAYCKVLCDEIFGRNNFVGTVIWEKADSPRMDVQFFLLGMITCWFLQKIYLIFLLIEKKMKKYLSIIIKQIKMDDVTI